MTGGQIIGSIAGGLLGSLFGKKPKGALTVTNAGTSGWSNDAAIATAQDSMATALQDSIVKIADALGATVGSYTVGLGRYKGYYQVASGADSRLGSAQYSQGNAKALYDGTDPAEALKAAIKNAIEDGAIQGVRASTQVLLKAGKDIDTQVSKAIKFENVFKRLKAYTDPVGAALDTLDAEFKNLQDIFKEAGASAAEYADLEKLYGLERAKAVKQATDQITASLQGLYDELTAGNDALSLRDRKAAALATYQPLADRVKAGDTSAYDDYAAAARQLLDIERQMSGSQSDYFTLLDEVTNLTKSKLDAAKTASDASANRDSPFSKTSSGSTPANDNASVKSALDALGVRLLDGLGYKLDAVNQNLGTMIEQVRSNGSIVPDYSRLTGRGTW